MPENPFSGWMNQQDQQKIDKDSMENYLWAGFSDWTARYYKHRQDPMYQEPGDAKKLYQSLMPQPFTPAEDYSPRKVVEVGRESTPGESIAKWISDAADSPAGVLLNFPSALSSAIRPDKTDTGFLSDTRRFAADFLRGAAYSVPQTVADIAGTIADAVTGNTGVGQSYQLKQNRPEYYSDPGGVGQTLGSFVPDILGGIGAYKLGARALTSAAAKAATGEATGIVGRVGAWAAAGAEPTALKMGGRFISPAATRIERAAASLAAGVPSAINVAPEVVSGRMNAAEGALTVALNTAAGPLSAGQWGGRMLTNIAGDVAVNVGTQAVSEVVPAVIPGGAEFDASQVWKNLAYGAAMGTMFGVMNAKPLQGPGERSTFGARVPEAQPVEPGFTTVGGGYKPKGVEVAQQTEQMLYGQTTLPDNATPDQVNARLNEMRRASPQELATLKLDEQGNVVSISEQYRNVKTDSAGIKNAIEFEREIYANALATRYSNNPQVLAQLLDLEIVPGELTPENAQAVLASKIKNEWLVQPVEGKGIAGVEQRLAQAGLASPLLAEAPISPAGAQAGYQPYAQEIPLQAEAPEQIPMQPVQTQFAEQAPIPTMEQAAMPQAEAIAGEAPQPTPGAISSMSMRAQRFADIEDASLKLGELKALSEIEGTDVANQLTPGSLEDQLYRAEQLGLTPDEAKRAVANNLQPTNEMALQIASDAQKSLESAKAVAEQANVSVEDIIPPGSVEEKLLQAENAGLPKDQAVQEVAQDLAERPESFNLTPAQEQNLAVEQAAPEVEQRIAAEEAPKRKRPRKAREVASTEKQGEILEALEGPETQPESDVEYKGQTARPGSTLEDDDLNRLSNVIMSTSDDVWRAISLWEKGREMSAAEKRATGKAGERAKEINRSPLRTGKKNLDIITGIFGEGQVANIYPPERGGNPTIQERTLAELEQVPPAAIRSAVASGRTKFFKGNISIEPTGKPNEYTIKLDMNPESKQRLATTMEYISKKEPTIEAKVSADATKRQRVIQEANKKLYADLEEVFAAQTDRNALYATRGIDVPEGIETEYFTEIANYGDDTSQSGLLESSGFNIEAALNEERQGIWRNNYIKKLNSAINYVATGLKKAGYTEADNIKVSDVKYYLLSKTGPGKFRNIGQMYVDSSMSKPVRAILDKEFDNIASGNAAGTSAIRNLIEHNSSIDDSYFNDLYYKYVPNTTEAMESAAIIADKIGVQDPSDIIRFARFDSKLESPTIKEKYIKTGSLLTAEQADFDKGKADVIRMKMDPLLLTDGDVLLAYDTVRTYVNKELGAESFRYVLNENMMGGAKGYKVSLRNLPGLRIASMTALMFMLDENVKKFEDDETYFGIPGSTLKALLGNGEAGVYALSTAGLFVAGVPARQKVGDRQGRLARIGNSVRKLIDNTAGRLNEPRVAISRMSPAKQSEEADMFMARKFPDIRPGTKEYEQLKAEKLANEKMADISGYNVRQIFDRFRKDKAAGTLSLMSRMVNDINLVGAKSQFVKEYIVKPYNEAQAQIRRIVKEIEDPVNGVIADHIKTYKKDRAFWDAFWALDYRMSDLELTNEGLSRAIIRESQVEVLNDIKNKYFKNADGTINEKKWSDFNDFQDKLNPVRKEHLRALVSKSIGINSWEVESHSAELLSTKSKLEELIGSTSAAIEEQKARLSLMDENYASLRKQVGADNAEKAMPGFAESRLTESSALREQMRSLRKFEYEHSKISKRLERIGSLDEMIEKSMANRYMYRLRDNKAPLVVRIAFDGSTGIPSARREYYNFADAKQGEIDIIRDAVTKIQATKPEYIEYIKRKKKITDRLLELDSEVERTPAMEAEYQKLSNQLDGMQGFKSVDEMTDAEVFRFANDYKQLGMQATVRDMRSRTSVTRGTKAARELLDMVMSSSEPIQAQLLSRTMDSGALIRPGGNDVDFVKGKGNASLVDFGGSGQVIMKQGDDAPSIDDLVNELDNLIDEPVDRSQLKELLETYYTYRDSGFNAKGQTVENVWIDMGAIRRLVEAYTDPYVPNLVKRNNWVGYYDPDGKWTTEERVNYTVKSIEGMLSQIQNYNQMTSMRKSIQQASNWLDKWDIQNGLREYISGLQLQTDNVLKGGWFDTWSQYETSIRRGISFATLMTNLGSNIGNRIQGFSMATAHGLMNATTKYGVYKVNSDGTKSGITWMPSEASARAELYKLQEKGENNWKIAEGFTPRAYIDPRTYGLGIAAIAAPKKALELLAKRDGYGKKPISEQGMWALIYGQSQAANLQQGGVTGSYTVREGIRTKTMGENLLKKMGALTDFVEEQNNYSSILLSGLGIQNKFGITDADWVSMNTGQKSEAALMALEPYTKRLEEAKRARALMGSEIEQMQRKIDEISQDPLREQEKIMLEKQMVSKKDRQARLATEASVFQDALTEYLVTNRGFEQGNWDPMSKSKFERVVESVPGGRLALTMTAPILRSYNSWQAMFREVGRTEGGKLAKLGRASGPLMGASILTVLLGGAANTAVGLGGVFFSDIAALAEMMYAYAVEEDGEKLDKVASRQAWEDIAGDLAEKYGMDPKDAKAFVRAAWPLGQSEGLLRQSFLDLNVNAGAGIWDITGGGTPAQVILGAGKSISQAWDVISTKLSQGSMTPYDFAYATSTAMPTSIKRLSQTGLQLLMPPSAGGFGAVKVDKFGQPVYDKDQNLQRLSGIDIFRNTFIGKPWSETRSKLTMYEGGTPLYTDDDRAAWANILTRTKYVQFGESSKSAFKGMGIAEQTNAARFEADAFELQRAITNKYKTYRPQVDEAKNVINTMYKENALIDIGGGEQIPFRKILSIVATAGVKAEEEIKGSAPDEVRKSLLSMVEDWGRSRAAAEAVYSYYGGTVQVKPAGDLYSSATGDVFALNKLGQRFSNAYLDYLARSKGRKMLGQ